MTLVEFNRIVADIEAHLEEGENYWLFFHLHSGNSVEGAWTFLNKEVYRDGAPILVVSHDDKPVIYVPLGAVEFINVSPS